jgi:N-methylhydantoinase A
LTLAFAPLLAEGARQIPGGALLRFADCRFAGQGYEVTVPVEVDDPERIRDAFLAAHRRRYGHGGGGLTVEIVNLRVVAIREGPLPRFAGETRAGRRPLGRRAFVVRGERVTASVWSLDEVAAGVTIPGPAILAGRDATALVEPGWCGTVHASGAVLLVRA